LALRFCTLISLSWPDKNVQHSAKFTSDAFLVAWVIEQVLKCIAKSHNKIGHMN